MSATKRTTVYLEARLHRALRVKALETDQSISDLVNAAVRASLAEDADDLHLARTRAQEPNLHFGHVLRNLKSRRKP